MLVNKHNCYHGEQICAGLLSLLDISEADEIKLNAIFLPMPLSLATLWLCYYWVELDTI